jgi:tRNA-dihydrouridine synthase B
MCWQTPWPRTRPTRNLPGVSALNATWLDLPKPWIILAPMASVGDFAFREICYRFGAEIAVSPLIAAHGLVASPKSVLKTVGARHGDRPFVVQLFGHVPEHFRRAARLLTDAFPLAGIDLNMGCPAQLVVGSGNGSALLKSPDLAVEVVAAARAGTDLPLSVKTRVGWDSVTILDLAPRLVDAGAQAITLHGRTREQQYGGSVDLEAIAALKRVVSVPVIGNGDVTSVESARAMLARTGVDGLMIGRAAVGNPRLFAEIRAALKGEVLADAAGVSRADLVREHVRLSFADEGLVAALTIRKHLMAYTRAVPGGAALRRLVQHLHGRAEVESWVERYAELIGDSRSTDPDDRAVLLDRAADEIVASGARAVG